MEELNYSQAEPYLSNMRLIVEGAISLYEGDLGKRDKLIYDIMGEALYSLRSQICDLQRELLLNTEEDNRKTL